MNLYKLTYKESIGEKKYCNHAEKKWVFYIIFSILKQLSNINHLIFFFQVKYNKLPQKYLLSKKINIYYKMLFYSPYSYNFCIL